MGGMAELLDEDDLQKQATAGDREALGRLLFAHRQRLLRHIGRKLPAALLSVVSDEDVLQQTFVNAFRDIRRFRPQGEGSFYAWLAAIADHRLLDAIKTHGRKKRGGDRQRVFQPREQGSTVGDLLDRLSDGGATPSGRVARREAVAALQIELAGLNDDYRRAIELRFVEGCGIEEIAAAMGRTPDAVRGLLYRAQQKLKEGMGRSSAWLTKK